jgi:enoyl-CoA hydratase/carnithine racemase
MSDYQEILYEVEDHIATITMHRPDRMNAMTNRMNGEIRHAVMAASDDSEVRAIILTGAGRGFCAGADVARLSATASGVEGEGIDLPVNGSIPGGLDLPDGFEAKYAYLATCPKPMIAAINGPAIGVGIVLSIYCDIRFASDTAKFSTAFGKRGLVPEYGMAWLLPKIIGPSKTMDLIYTSRMVLADEAKDIGLVDYVAPSQDLMNQARDFARTIATDVSPRSTRVAKQLVYRGLSQEIDSAVSEAIAATETALKSDDFKEGIAAWQEKRPPAFTGK